MYDALAEHDREDYIESEVLYLGLVEILRNIEPSLEQYQKMFNQ